MAAGVEGISTPVMERSRTALIWKRYSSILTGCRRVGSALVDAVVVRAGRNGRSMITASANWHALAFEEQAGFVRVGMVELESGETPRMALSVTSAGDATSHPTT